MYGRIYRATRCEVASKRDIFFPKERYRKSRRIAVQVRLRGRRSCVWRVASANRLHETHRPSGSGKPPSSLRRSRARQGVRASAKCIPLISKCLNFCQVPTGRFALLGRSVLLLRSPFPPQLHVTSTHCCNVARELARSAYRFRRIDNCVCQR